MDIQTHSYLDDSLIKELNPDILLSHTQTVIDLLLELGFLISWKKSEVIPSQDRRWGPMLEKIKL
jgi:predicted SprT family Zn-dependent metalloprotease